MQNLSPDSTREAENSFHYDESWLSKYTEDILEPDLRIIDPHHHLWGPERGTPYLFSELLRDLPAGHNIEATVYCQCYAMFTAEAPQATAPWGGNRVCKWHRRHGCKR